MKRFCIALTLLLQCVAGAEILPAPDAPQPLTPQESAAKMRLPEGFRIELVASEPLVKEPSCIAFDEHGDMFVCELHGYNVEGHVDTQVLNKTGVLDTQVRRIRWELQGGEIAMKAAALQYGVLKKLSDRDGDGVMDEALTWADDLPPSYGVLPVRGGVIVTCAPHIMFFADRDRDGLPEVRETLYTGFDIRVLERGINNPRWGFDGWIYVGSGGDGGTITGPHLKEPVKIGSNDFRIKADGTAIEPVNGRVGTFGMTINDDGDRFPSTGGNPAIYALPLPYHYLKRNPFVATPSSNHAAAHYNQGYRISEPHPWRVRRGQDPAWVEFYGKHETTSIYFSGGCSTTYFSDASFPDAYQGNLFYCEPSLNIVHRCLLERDGAGYTARRAPGEEKSEFLASTDQWFRPMNLRAGPNGALYIVDMYREIIEDYSAIPRFLQQQYGLDKGKEHGRIWRLLPKNQTHAPTPNFANLSTQELVSQLNEPFRWRRLTAQRLLIERADREAVKPLQALLRAPETNRNAAILGLYTLRMLGGLDERSLTIALKHHHHSVRRHALRCLTKTSPFVKELKSMIDDPDPMVRLQLAMTLGNEDHPEAANALRKLVLNHGGDRWMKAAILSSLNNANGWRLLQSWLGKINLPQDVLAWIQPVTETIAGRGDDKLIELLILASGAEPASQIASLTGLLARLDSKRVGDRIPTARLEPFMRSRSPKVRLLAFKLARKLARFDSVVVKNCLEKEITTTRNLNATPEERLAAIQMVAQGPFESLHPLIRSLLGPKEPPEMQKGAVDVLANVDDPRVGEVLLQAWPQVSPEIRKAILKAVFEREDRLAALLDSIEKGIITRGELTVVQRDQLLKSRFSTRAGELLPDQRDEATTKRLQRYQQALKEPRDVANGRAVYDKNCLICHVHDKRGSAVGPALDSLSNQPDEAVLVDLLDPGSKIDPEYTLYIVNKRDGSASAGILESESATSVTIRRADGTAEVILRREIAKIESTSVSLMPANLHETISPKDAADLIAFLKSASAETEASGR